MKILVHDIKEQEPNPVRLSVYQDGDSVNIAAVHSDGRIISTLLQISEQGVYAFGNVCPSLGLPLDPSHNNCVSTRLSMPESR
jgi:hypothetical protein